MTHSIFETDVAPEAGDGSPPHRRAGFGYDVDGTSYDYDLPTITGAQLLFRPASARSWGWSRS